MARFETLDLHEVADRDSPSFRGMRLAVCNDEGNCVLHHPHYASQHTRRSEGTAPLRAFFTVHLGDDYPKARDTYNTRLATWLIGRA